MLYGIPYLTLFTYALVLFVQSIQYLLDAGCYTIKLLIDDMEDFF